MSYVREIERLGREIARLEGYDAATLSEGQRAQLADYRAQRKALSREQMSFVRSVVDQPDQSRERGSGVLVTDGGRRSGYSDAGGPAALKSMGLTRDQSMYQDAQRAGVIRPDGPNYSFGKLIRGLATDDWTGAEDEKRAVSESPATAGGHLVPTPVAVNVIDRARAVAQVFRAGALTVPMTSSSLKVPRLTGEPTPAWRLENGAINDQALTFDSVTLTAQSMAIMVKCSWELLEDAPNIDAVVSNSFAQAIALEIDRAALRGSGTPPEPRGIRNTTGVTLTSHGANGDTTTNLKWTFLLQAQAAVRTNGFEPTGVIYHPRTELGLASLTDTTGQYIQPPSALNNLPRFSTTNLPINLTVGTSVDASEVYTADWTKMVVGIRHQMRIRRLEERFADFGQVAFLCDMRADVALLQPSAFVVDLGVRS